MRKAADKGVVVSWFHFPKAHPGVLRSSFPYDWWNEKLIFDNSDPIGANILIPDAYRIVRAALER